MHLLSKAIIAIFVSYSIFALADTEKRKTECANATPDAQLSVPFPGGNFAQIVCSKFGHILAPADKWLWTNPGAMRPVFLPAQMVRGRPKVVNDDVYFSSILSRELTAEETAKKWSEMPSSSGLEIPTNLKAFEIQVENNIGGKHTAYIFNNSWGYACSPNCVTELVFIMVNKDKEPVAW